MKYRRSGIQHTPSHSASYVFTASVISGIALLSGAAITALFILFGWATLQIDDLERTASKPPSSTIFYYSDGSEMARLHRERREAIALNQMPDHLIDALLATEDRRFMEHSGVDWRRLISATFNTLRGNRQGGSTLTMQLVRNRYPSIQERPPVLRKALEIQAARRLERSYDKNRLLEMYLNDVPFGQRAHGIQAAATAYFGVEPSELAVHESATLVAILKGSTYYNPLRNPERARERRNLVLRQLQDTGSLSSVDRERMEDEPLDLSPNAQSLDNSLAPHAVRHIERELADWLKRSNLDIYADGLRIHTTINAYLQRVAYNSVQQQGDLLQHVAAYEWAMERPDFLGREPELYRERMARGDLTPFEYLADVDHTAPEDTVLQTGFVAIEPSTGRVQAWVGSRGFPEIEFDYVAQAKRQPGSTFKPFVFAAAMDRGFRPDDIWAEGRIQQASYTEGTPYAEGTPLRSGLAWSSNELAMHLIETISPNNVVRTARQMGINSELRAFPSLAFGTSEVTLLEMISSYSTMANGGQYNSPQLIARVEDEAGNVVFGSTRETLRGASALTSYAVIDMMRDVVEYGTGRDIRQRFGVDADVAGKTGTTQGNADGWFLMAHPQLVMGAWMGFNNRAVSFRTEHWGRGANNALRVVGSFTREAIESGMLSDEVRFARPPAYDATRPNFQSAGGVYGRGDYYEGRVGVLRGSRDSIDRGMDSTNTTYVRDRDVEATLRRSARGHEDDD